jgi:hypothetical protein
MITMCKASLYLSTHDFSSSAFLFLRMSGVRVFKILFCFCIKKTAFLTSLIAALCKWLS